MERGMEYASRRSAELLLAPRLGFGVHGSVFVCRPKDRPARTDGMKKGTQLYAEMSCVTYLAQNVSVYLFHWTGSLFSRCLARIIEA